jgi:hypothetical protein
MLGLQLDVGLYGRLVTELVLIKSTLSPLLT